MPTIDRESLRQLNLYEVLQVSAKASPEVVHAAYRVLARSYHPDINSTPNAARMMRQLNAAYNVLSDPERRARYDAHRSVSWRARGANRATRRATAQQDSSPPAVSTTVSAPLQSGWRVWRVMGLVIVMLALFGALVAAFWLVAGALEEQPYSVLRAAGMVVGS